MTHPIVPAQATELATLQPSGTLGAPGRPHAPSAAQAKGLSTLTFGQVKIQLPTEIANQVAARIGNRTPSQVNLDVKQSFSPAVAAINIADKTTFTEDKYDAYLRPKALQKLTPNQVAELFGFRAAQAALSQPLQIGNQKIKSLRVAQTTEFQFTKGFPYVKPAYGTMPDISTIARVYADAVKYGWGSEDFPGYRFLAFSRAKILVSNLPSSFDQAKNEDSSYGKSLFYTNDGQALQVSGAELFGVDSALFMMNFNSDLFKSIMDTVYLSFGQEVQNANQIGLSGPHPRIGPGSGSGPATTSWGAFDPKTAFQGRSWTVHNGRTVYKVQRGDTMRSIANRFGHDVSMIPALVAANPNAPHYRESGVTKLKLTPGQVINIPNFWANYAVQVGRGPASAKVSTGAPKTVVIPGTANITLPASAVQQIAARIGKGGIVSKWVAAAANLSPAVAAIDISDRNNFVEDLQDWGRRPKALQGLTANQVAELFGMRAAQGAIAPLKIGDPKSKAKNQQQSVDFDFMYGFPYVFPKGGQDVFINAGRQLLSTIGSVFYDAVNSEDLYKTTNAPGYDFLARSLVKLLGSESHKSGPIDVANSYGAIGFLYGGSTGSLADLKGQQIDFEPQTAQQLFGYSALDRLTQMAGGLVNSSLSGTLGDEGDEPAEGDAPAEPDQGSPDAGGGGDAGEGDAGGGSTPDDGSQNDPYGRPAYLQSMSADDIGHLFNIPCRDGGYFTFVWGWPFVDCISTTSPPPPTDNTTPSVQSQADVECANHPDSRDCYDIRVELDPDFCKKSPNDPACKRWYNPEVPFDPCDGSDNEACYFARRDKDPKFCINNPQDALCLEFYDPFLDPNNKKYDPKHAGRLNKGDGGSVPDYCKKAANKNDPYCAGFVIDKKPAGGVQPGNTKPDPTKPNPAKTKPGKVDPKKDAKAVAPMAAATTDSFYGKHKVGIWSAVALSVVGVGGAVGYREYRKRHPKAGGTGGGSTPLLG
jgi:hypothetical protein